jgi:hypothetical protein
MGDFRSFKTLRRLPAEPMRPVVDPGRLVAGKSQGRRALELSAHRS